MRGLLLAAILAANAFAQPYDSNLLSALRWRSIGPYRGGRTRAVAGVASQPAVFFMAQVNGGIWKTGDFGRTWSPIFDDQPTGSIGALAVAPSDPNIIYAGSGEGLHRPDLSVGDGIYKSADGGKTWTHLGLRAGQQIPQIAVDPLNADRVFVAVLGHPYGPNPERGIFRSVDGGRTFEKVLYKDENTCGSDVAIDPAHPETVYAALWEAREGPWENGNWSGTGGGVFKSTDGGNTWRPLTHGLPAGIVQANLAIAPSMPRRIYASAFSANELGNELGIYRSDDAGESWSRITTDPRPATRVGGGGELPVLRVDPRNPDVVYSASIVAWKSSDGGKTWSALRGAPGGDDYQNLWINPDHPEIIALVSDQGAIVTVNGGATWSSWYNQPTAQMYHVIADNAFPYRLCGGQQESGSACVASRGNDGAITFREWHPAGFEEYGYAAPDPLDPDIVYGGKLTRYNRRTGQVEDVTPKPLRSGNYRVVRTEPVVFSPVDPHVLYFAANRLWKTRDGGHHWSEISPDLARKTWEVPATVGKYRGEASAKATQRGVIYAVAPSPLDGNRIWAGTDDGLIHLTVDGGLHWRDVTPRALVPWAKVSILDAGHFDAATCYAAVNTLRLDDMRPHIYRTRDSGKTWQEVAAGIPDGAPVNAVREDPKRKGLLFAATEREVYASFDDGDHWQSLRLNMPATSVRDVIVKDNDLAAATHGRGFWILDDIAPLRQLAPAVTESPAFLFRPEEAVRVRWNMNQDTPLPPDEPAGENPPDGAILDYWLGGAGAVTLEIHDSAGKLVRRWSSGDPVEKPDPQLTIPAYWVRPPERLSGAAGMHRFVWDLHYPPAPGQPVEYPISAVYRNTAPDITSPWVMPGRYTVTLTAGGRSYTETLAVRMDPRVHTPAAALAEQLAVSMRIYNAMLSGAKAQAEVSAARERLSGDLATQVAELAGSGAGRRRARAAESRDTLASVMAQLTTLLREIQSADAAPAAQARAAAEDRTAALRKLVDRWGELRKQI